MAITPAPTENRGPAFHDSDAEKRADAAETRTFTWMIVAGLLGLVVILGAPLGLILVDAAQHARDDAARAAQTAQAHNTAPAESTSGMKMPAASADGKGAYATASFAGIAPQNADELAMAHKPFPAELPPAPAGREAHVVLPIQHTAIDIAPGIKYNAWTFGPTVPGPVIHVRQGQLVHIHLRNDSPMPHSVDFHAARLAPNVSFSDVMPGETKMIEFRAGDPGVYMYHCGTAPAFMHIANGMYGAIVVEPKGLPHADKQFVLVSGEYYLNRPGDEKPADLDMTKALHMTPDWVAFNGYAHQYKEHPLTANPGDTVRFWVMDGGPSLNTEFHVVGTVFERAWINADLVDAPQHLIQTGIVPAGGGGVFDVRITKPGIYPFVSHSFASVQMGEVGLLKVGDVDGSMSH